MSLEFNKIAASILTAGVVAMGSGFVADLLVNPKTPDEPAYAVATKDKDKGGGKPSKPKGPRSVLPLMASADAGAGENAARACQACHSFNKGGPNKVGPNLYNVVGSKIASAEGFSYSQALMDKEGEWTYEKLSKFLHNPSGWAPGTKMSYAGVKDVEKRANLIAYLREQADSPMDLPSEDEVAAAKKADAGDTASGDGGGGSGDGGSGSTGGEQMAKAEGATDKGASGGDGGGNAHAMIAKASAAKGESAVAVCKACHSFNKGGPNKVGPNLYNVVGSDIAADESFSYSDALKSKEGSWTYDKLWAYLENPQGWAPGTNMSYPGIKDPAKRANVIAYLKQQSDNPPELETDSAAASDGGETQTAKAETGGDGSATDGAADSAADGGADSDGADQAASDEADAATQTGNGQADGARADGGDRAKAEQASDAATGDAGDSGSASDAAETADSGDTGNGGETTATDGGGGDEGATQTAKATSGGAEIHGKIAEASASKGATAVAVCKACHSFNKGGPNKVGPNLYGVVGSDIASTQGFSYSKALSGKNGAWTYTKLWNYLENPQGWAPGTRMSYPGVKDPGKRANIIAYLKQQADDAPELNP